MKKKIIVEVETNVGRAVDADARSAEHRPVIEIVYPSLNLPVFGDVGGVIANAPADSQAYAAVIGVEPQPVSPISAHPIARGESNLDQSKTPPETST